MGGVPTVERSQREVREGVSGSGVWKGRDNLVKCQK